MERRARPAERGARPKEAPSLTLGARARKPEKGFAQRSGRTPDQSPDGDSPEIESVSEAWGSPAAAELLRRRSGRSDPDRGVTAVSKACNVVPTGQKPYPFQRSLRQIGTQVPKTAVSSLIIKSLRALSPSKIEAQTGLRKAYFARFRKSPL